MTWASRAQSHLWCALCASGCSGFAAAHTCAALRAAWYGFAAPTIPLAKRTKYT
jgi:hypothetical protein